VRRAGGREALLEEIIAGSFDCFGNGDDYRRGQAINALAAATVERGQRRVCLDDASVRKYAPTALGEIAKRANDPDDIAALAVRCPEKIVPL
jgi:hypothetical protein